NFTCPCNTPRQRTINKLKNVILIVFIFYSCSQGPSSQIYCCCNFHYTEAQEQQHGIQRPTTQLPYHLFGWHGRNCQSDHSAHPCNLPLLYIPIHLGRACVFSRDYSPPRLLPAPDLPNLHYQHVSPPLHPISRP